MNDVIIYSNPGFGIPRDTLAVIHYANIEPTIVANKDGNVVIDVEGKRVRSFDQTATG
ncbi:thioredoxin domain-containing protein [Paraburkholderia strydomiana]|uniref:hypothetical protein n=1 Tax=Paraburkholderia strydomiana TaxID=1245417 RepID=UPI0038BA540C